MEGGGGLVSLLSPQVPVGWFFMKVSGLGLMGYETPYPEPRTLNPEPHTPEPLTGSFRPWVVWAESFRPGSFRPNFGVSRFGLF